MWLEGVWLEGMRRHGQTCSQTWTTMTRRQYDRDRDKLDANNDAGLMDSGKMEKPPPTCVDVEFTLEEVRSCR